MSKKDLEKPVENIILRNQKGPTGNQYFVEIDGILQEYFHDEDLFIIDR